MRIIRLPMRPEWMAQAEAETQDRIVGRLFLHSETVNRVCYWYEPQDMVYIDMQMGPSGVLGTWHKYLACSRFEWIRALLEVRDLYANADQEHQRLMDEFNQQLERMAASMRAAKLKESPNHNWKSEGF